MRKIIYFIFLIVTFYLAGRHKLKTLILLVFSVLILFIILFLTTKYFKKNIDVEIEVSSRKVKKGNIIKGSIVVINKSFLPITRFTIKVEYFNNKVLKPAVKVIKGYVPANSTTKMEFQMKSKYCGILDLKIKEIKVYDYFLLFKRKKKIQSHKEVLILPSGYPLKSEVQSNDYIYFPLEEGRNSESLMNQPPEILWIDKYKHGDSMRDIHWKLSARNDEILSKKYSSDIQNRITFFIDLRTEKDISIERKDVFYELCSSISLGLIENKVSHIVRWYDIKNMSMVEELVRTEEDYINMIENLMLKAELFNEKANDKLLNEIYFYEDPFENTITLNLEFKLFLNKDLLMEFSEENYLDEIERRCLTV